MLEAGEEIPKFVTNMEQLEKIPRGTHRLVSKALPKEIWHRDKCYVYIQRELKGDQIAGNDWLREMNFKVITEDEAFPGRAEEQRIAETNTKGPQMVIK